MTLIDQDKSSSVAELKKSLKCSYEPANGLNPETAEFSRVSSVNIVTRLCAGHPVSGRGPDFSFLHTVRTDSGSTQPSIQCLPEALPSQVKQPGRDQAWCCG
jgi:hypothetical protein